MDGVRKAVMSHITKFKGEAEKWGPWKDLIEALFGAQGLTSAIDEGEPNDQSSNEEDEEPAGDAIANENQGGDEKEEANDDEGGGENQQAGGAEIQELQRKGARRSLRLKAREKYSEKCQKINLYLLIFTEGAAQAVVSQFRASRNEVLAWYALRENLTIKNLWAEPLYTRR